MTPAGRELGAAGEAAGGSNREAGKLRPSERLLSGTLLTARVAIAVHGGLPGILSLAIDLGREHVEGRRVERSLQQIAADVAELQRAFDALPAEQREVVTGAPLALLRFTVDRALATLWGAAESHEARAALDLTGADYAAAARELESRGLVIVDGSAGAPGGAHRVRLMPATILRVGPQLYPSVDFADEIGRILARIAKGGAPGQQFTMPSLTADAGIPLPRLDALVNALVAIGVVEGDERESAAWGSHFVLALTARGQRIFRGDAPLPLL